MFIGKSFRTIDEKGRVVLPPNFRRLLESDDRCSVVVGPKKGNCLMLQRPDDFEADAQKMLEASQTSSKKYNDFRFFMGRSNHLEIDKAGRITLSEEFRDYAGIQLGDEVIINGVLTGAEIWSRDRWQVKEALGAASFPTEDDDEEVYA
jgi:MraZ protein